MKTVPKSIFLSVFFCLVVGADVQCRPDRSHSARRARHSSSRMERGGHRRLFESEQELNDALDNLAKDSYSSKKLVNLKMLLMKTRGISVSEQSQTKFNALLHEACDNYNKDDRRDVFALRGILHLSQRSRLLSENNKQYVDKKLSDIVANSGEDIQRPLNIENLNSVSAKDNYSAKAMSLCRIMRRPNRGDKIDKNVQSETSSAIHDLYANRPLNNPALLSKLRDVLNLAGNTPLLSTINQYEVKEIMLPEVTKNVEKAALIARNIENDRPGQAVNVKSVDANDLAKIDAGQSIKI